MSDPRAQIQLARIQDDAWLWSTLVQQLMQDSPAEGMKAALSGATRGTPGGQVKDRAVELIVSQLEPAAQSDLVSAMDAAVTAAIYSRPDSKERAAATAFIVGHLENLAEIDSNLAVSNSQFALGWVRPGSAIEREAARIWDRLNVERPGAESEQDYAEGDILTDSADDFATAKRA